MHRPYHFPVKKMVQHSSFVFLLLSRKFPLFHFALCTFTFTLYWDSPFLENSMHQRSHSHFPILSAVISIGNDDVRVRSAAAWGLWGRPRGAAARVPSVSTAGVEIQHAPARNTRTHCVCCVQCADADGVLPGAQP